MQNTARFLKELTPYHFSFLDVTTRNVIVHEAGHALAALAVYQNASPKIAIYPGMGGATSYYNDNLSWFGKLLGRKNSDLLVCGAGAAMAILFSIGSLAAAKRCSSDKPELKMYLIATAIVSIVQHIFYALTAFITGADQLSHDFVALWSHGINPLIAIIAMIFLPIFVYYSIPAKNKDLLLSRNVI